jgi:hypothetical protein
MLVSELIDRLRELPETACVAVFFDPHALAGQVRACRSVGSTVEIDGVFDVETVAYGSPEVFIAVNYHSAVTTTGASPNADVSARLH